MRSPDVFSLPCISLYTTPESWPLGSIWCTCRVRKPHLNYLVWDLTDLCYEPCLRHRWVQNVINIDRKKLQETLLSGRGNRVRCMICIRPRIGPIGESAIR